MLKAALFGIVGALVAVAIAVILGDGISGPLILTSPGADAPEELALGAALFATVIGGIAGVGLAALCRRFLDSPAPAFVGICIAGLVGYGIFSFTASEAVATGVWLNVMHIAAAIPIVGLLAAELQPSKAG